jgi:hypothetical protein
MSAFRIATVVEGHGEVIALPVLLRRIVAEILPTTMVEVPRPHRQNRSNLVAVDGLETILSVVSRQVSPHSRGPGAVLVLLDADDDCPADLGPSLLERARAAGSGVPVCTVLANREFEAWFLAGASSLSGHRGLADNLQIPSEPEKPRDCKGWLSANRTDGRSYKPASDQAALAAVLDLGLARQNSESFDKLWRDLERLLGGIA